MIKVGDQVVAQNSSWSDAEDSVHYEWVKGRVVARLPHTRGLFRKTRYFSYIVEAQHEFIEAIRVIKLEEES